MKNSNLYIGYTTNPRKRLLEHNRGLNFSTKSGKPWEVIHAEAYRHLEDAKRRESYLKTNQGAQIIKRLLKEFFYVQRSKNKSSFY